MKTLWLILNNDLKEAIKAKWFFIYTLIFGGAVLLLFAMGITESRVMGFIGLSRLLLTYIQLCVAIMPVFILVTTVKTVVGERESHVLEYFLSMPVSLAAYYWGKLLARFLAVILPVFVALLGALIWGEVQSLEVPWNLIGWYLLLLVGLAWCFLGMGILVSSVVRRFEWGLGLTLLLWIVLLLFIDVILIGIMLQYQVQEEVIIGLALLNPLQVFRTGAYLLFDPALSSIGPASYVILDHFGKAGYQLFSVLYPLGLGWFFSVLGFWFFKRGDLI